MEEKNIWKWALQTFLPVILFITYEQTQTEPFSSEHAIARYVILIGLYFAWNIYVTLVRKGKL